MKKAPLLFYLITLFIGSKIMAQETNSLTLNTLAHEGTRIREGIKYDKTTLINQNNTHITQIGDYNLIVSQLIAPDQNKLTYIQYGSENNIDIHSINETSQQDIYQLGNNNVFSLYNYNSFENQNIQILQSGNKQSIEIFGENSISKDMKIISEGSDQTLLIRNFN